MFLKFWSITLPLFSAAVYFWKFCQYFFKRYF